MQALTGRNPSMRDAERDVIINFKCVVVVTMHTVYYRKKGDYYNEKATDCKEDYRAS